MKVVFQLSRPWRRMQPDQKNQHGRQKADDGRRAKIKQTPAEESAGPRQHDPARQVTEVRARVQMPAGFFIVPQTFV